MRIISILGFCTFAAFTPLNLLASNEDLGCVTTTVSIPLDEIMPPCACGEGLKLNNSSIVDDRTMRTIQCECCPAELVERTSSQFVHSRSLIVFTVEEKRMIERDYRLFWTGTPTVRAARMKSLVNKLTAHGPERMLFHLYEVIGWIPDISEVPIIDESNLSNDSLLIYIANNSSQTVYGTDADRYLAHHAHLLLTIVWALTDLSYSTADAALHNYYRAAARYLINDFYTGDGSYAGEIRQRILSTFPKLLPQYSDWLDELNLYMTDGEQGRTTWSNPENRLSVWDFDILYRYANGPILTTESIPFRRA